jgi:hypothetical protein
MGKKRRLVEQFGNKIGYWSGKGESREFIALTNFGVRILKFIEAPPDYKGFLVEVTQDRKRTAVKGYGMAVMLLFVHVQFHYLRQIS